MGKDALMRLGCHLNATDCLFAPKQIRQAQPDIDRFQSPDFVVAAYDVARATALLRMSIAFASDDAYRYLAVSLQRLATAMRFGACTQDDIFAPLHSTGSSDFECTLRNKCRSTCISEQSVIAQEPRLSQETAWRCSLIRHEYFVQEDNRVESQKREACCK